MGQTASGSPDCGSLELFFSGLSSMNCLHLEHFLREENNAALPRKTSAARRNLTCCQTNVLKNLYMHRGTTFSNEKINHGRQATFELW